MSGSQASFWPAEMLGRILHFLAMDGASWTWNHLAYLTHKNEELSNIARKMQRPLVLRVGFGNSKSDGDDKKRFILPYRRATVAHLEIDWGDNSPVQIIHEVGNGCMEHEYKDAGEYTVRVFPYGQNSSIASCLNHLGWSPDGEDDLILDKEEWWGPLRSLDTLGTLGISSLDNLFNDATGFNLPLSHLNVSEIESMRGLFYNAASFNQPLARWDVSSVVDMRYMFDGAENFNQYIGSWDTSRVERMKWMFSNAKAFDQPIGDWDTSNVCNMKAAFFDAISFNQDISRWNVSKVTDMSLMFCGAASFNQPIGLWDVSNVKSMRGMFWTAFSFNQPLGAWNVNAVRDLRGMFLNAEQFNQDIGDWNVSNVENVKAIFDGAVAFDRSCLSAGIYSLMWPLVYEYNFLPAEEPKDDSIVGFPALSPAGGLVVPPSPPAPCFLPAFAESSQ